MLGNQPVSPIRQRSGVKLGPLGSPMTYTGNSRLLSPRYTKKQLDNKFSEEKQRMNCYKENAYSRDISHIKDRSPQRDGWASYLPTEISLVKMLLETSDKRGLHTTVDVQGNLQKRYCFKEECMDFLARPPNVRSTREIDRYNLGNPTGRQDVQLLEKWLNQMKGKYFDNDGDKITVLNACIREIVRQVRVQCIDRGRVLREVLDELQEFYRRKIEELNREIEGTETKAQWKMEMLIEKNKQVYKELAKSTLELEGQLGEARERNSEKDNNLTSQRLRIRELENEIEMNQKEAPLKRFTNGTLRPSNTHIRKYACKGTRVGDRNSTKSDITLRSKNEAKDLNTDTGLGELSIPTTRKGDLFSIDSQGQVDIQQTIKRTKSIEIQCESKETPAEVPHKQQEIELLNRTPVKSPEMRENHNIPSETENSEEEQFSSMLVSHTPHPTVSPRISPIFGLPFKSRTFRTENPDHHKLKPLIPPGAHIPSWKSGFAVGVESGKSIGLEEGQSIGEEIGYLQGISDRVEQDSDESDTSPPHSKDQNNFVSNTAPLKGKFNRNLTRKTTTKPVEFTWSPIRKQIDRKKTVFSGKILEKLLEKPMGMIKRMATMSSRLVHKIISATYLSAYGLFKEKNSEVPNLLEIIYEDFGQKYGLKAVHKRKFQDFIASVFKAKTRRSALFLQFIHAAHRVKQINYTESTMQFFLDVYNFMITSKVGIIVNLDESADNLMIPVLRAIECVKEKYGEKEGFTGMLTFIESHAESDPKRINPGGLINCDVLIEEIVKVYEKRYNDLYDGAYAVYDALLIESGEIDRTDLEMVGKLICPKKLPGIQQLDETIALDNFIEKNIEREFFYMSSIEKWLGDLVEPEGILMEKKKSETFFINSSSYNEKMIHKLQKLENSIGIRNAMTLNFSWKIFFNELMRARRIST